MTKAKIYLPLWEGNRYRWLKKCEKSIGTHLCQQPVRLVRVDRDDGAASSFPLPVHTGTGPGN